MSISAFIGRAEELCFAYAVDYDSLVLDAIFRWKSSRMITG
mgnify:CR=1 FL=1